MLFFSRYLGVSSIFTWGNKCGTTGGKVNLLSGRTHDNLAWASSHRSNLDVGKSNENILYPQGNWYTCQDKRAADEQGMTSTFKILLYKFEVES